MTLQIDGKFEEELTCSLENDMKNLVNFHQSTVIGCFYPKQIMYELKTYREVMCKYPKK